MNLLSFMALTFYYTYLCLIILHFKSILICMILISNSTILSVVDWGKMYVRLHIDVLEYLNLSFNN